MSRVIRLVLSLVTLLLLATCATYDHMNRIVRSSTSATVVVRHDGTVDQDTVELQARNGLTTSGTPVPAQLLWVAENSADTLMIELIDHGCFSAKSCSGPTCTAVTNTGIHGKNMQCQYKVWLNNTSAHDPIVIVDDCCP